MLFDSHTHFNDGSFSARARQALLESVDSAVKEGRLSHAVDIGFDLASSKLAVAHADRYDWCYATVGCHPHNAKDMDDMELALIKGLLNKKKVVALGEIGLDFYRNISEKDVQREWFRKQIRVANEKRMPIIIHSRDADQEVMDILKEEGAFSEERKRHFPKRPDPAGFAGGKNGMADDARVLLHCYSGSAELAKQYVKLGGTISIAGPVTYKNNRKTAEVCRTIPLEFLLIETDAPYLTPEPFRGKRNTPLLVKHTAEKIAEIKGVTFEDVAGKTRENAMRFYGL